jgi:uncharacterized cupin superfamily protein
VDLLGIGTPRRFVTGLHPDGTSYFARIEEVEELDYSAVYPDSPPNRPAGASKSHRMWAWDEFPTLPIDGTTPLLDPPVAADEAADALRRTSPFPPLGGARINLIKFPGLAPGTTYKPGVLHWHDTVNLQWLIAGEIVMRLDDSSEVTMRPGDLVVQHGTNHAWEVRTEEGAVLAVIIFGAERDGVRPPESTKHIGTAQPTGPDEANGGPAH